LPWKIDEKSALIIVDVQKDFCPGGALPVSYGDRVVPIFNTYINRFLRVGAPMVATRDWHPSNHISFQDRGGSWPPHCVQGSEGAKFHPELKLSNDMKIVSKGVDPKREQYSDFQGTGLADLLKEKGVETVYIGGLATDYCVKATVLDALEIGFKTILLMDASKGVDVNPGDSDKAVEQMVMKGAHKTTLSDIK